MDLLTKLRDLAAKLPPSHLIGEAEAARIVSALVHANEHGEEIFQAAERGENDVHRFFTDVGAGEVPDEGRTDAATGKIIPGSRPDQQPEPDQPAVSADDHAALVAQLQQAQADLADARRATVTSDPPPEPGTEGTVPAEPEPQGPAL